jgi:hypothetical protein
MGEGVKMSEKIKMTVTMDVTEPQALALQAMFKYWTDCGRRGHDAKVGFYVFGCCDFRPECKVTFDREIRELTPEMEKAAKKKGDVEVIFDYDPIACLISEQK